MWAASSPRSTSRASWISPSSRRRWTRRSGKSRRPTKAEGVQRIYIPGEIELETKADRLKNGIPIPDAVVKDFTALGKELAVAFPTA